MKLHRTLFLKLTAFLIQMKYLIQSNGILILARALTEIGSAASKWGQTNSFLSIYLLLTYYIHHV